MKLSDKDIENLINYLLQIHTMVKENNQKIRDMDLLLQKFARNVGMKGASECLKD